MQMQVMTTLLSEGYKMTTQTTEEMQEKLSDNERYAIKVTDRHPEYKVYEQTGFLWVGDSKFHYVQEEGRKLFYTKACAIVEAESTEDVVKVFI